MSEYVNKEFLTKEEMLDYFNLANIRSLLDWEQLGLRARYVTGKTKYYWWEDVRKFLLGDDYKKELLNGRK